MASSNGGIPRLRSLDLQGYKTFASKTEIALAPTITVVVGPNGSGKSNIADAIRWVLGEQSYSLLRGRKTEDMIFSGSETKARASMAAATIEFDNSDGWLPIDFTEVNITRRAYRDGQNEYLINGQRVRLRDVSELLASSGLGQRTYTIIGQGLVDAALSLRAEERRKLFEEAAGIGLYRSRREEALRRLDNTRRNLERVQDILTELQPRLRSLKRQAKRADEYHQVKRDLDSALRTWYGYHWYHLLESVTKVSASAEGKRQKRDEIRNQQVSVERALSDTRHQIDSLRSQLQIWSQRISTLYTEREAKGRTFAVSQERLRWLADQENLIRKEITTLEQSRSRLHEDLSQTAEEEKRRRQEVEVTHAELQELESGTVETASLRTHLERAEETRKALENLAAEQAAWRTRGEQFAERINRLTSQRAELSEERRALEQAVTQAEQKSLEAAQTHQEAENEHQQTSADCTDAQHDLATIESDYNRQRERVVELETQQARLEALQQVKRTALDSHADFVDLLQRGEGDGGVQGFVGVLGDRLKVDSRYQVAINAALGEFRRSLAFETVDDLLNTLAWLGREGLDSKAAFLALTPQTAPNLLKAPSDSGSVDNAASLVRVEAKFQVAIDILLGQTIVVMDVDAAQRVLPNLPVQARVVTLQGDLFFQTGQVLLGRGDVGDEDPEALRSLEAELAAVNENLETARTQEKALADRYSEARGRLEHLQAELERMRTELLRAAVLNEQAQIAYSDAKEKRTHFNQQVEDLNESISRAEDERRTSESQGSYFEAERSRLEEVLNTAVVAVESADPNVGLAKAQARLEVARSSLAEARRRSAESERRLADAEDQLKDWEDRLTQNQTERSEAQREAAETEQGTTELEGQISALQDQIEPAEGSLLEAESKRNELEAEGNRLRSALQAAERTHSQAQIELARRQEELSSLRRRIEDDYGLVAFDFSPGVTGQKPLPLDGLVEHLPRIAELPPELESQVNHLRAQIRRMGAVNPEAQREYTEVSERVEFMTSQLEDLGSAELRIHEVITELDLLMEREFRKTFDEVAAVFKDSFKRLFGGGSARLVLTEPGDLTQTGIDIETRLPGRREQGLAVLSGGERSLVATALIFSLLKVSPTPFCVLDEVDAMLDESNVMRFCDMLRELSEETQFVVITHNRLTVQAAEVIYGVSMGADSVSRVISLKLDEVEKELAS